jgi:hypothetical protein
MRVSDDRYNRDLRSFHLALTMIRFEARTHTISAWTGFTHERVRNLAKSHREERAEAPPERHRGPSPKNLTLLLTSPGLRSELAAMAGLCHVLGVIPAQRLANARERLPSVSNGERLCFALELFRQVVPQARLTLEQAVLLVFALAEGERWSVDHCAGCRALILVDHWNLTRRVCVHCQQESRASRGAEPCDVEANVDEDSVSSPAQQDLFSAHVQAPSDRQRAKERVVARKDQHGARRNGEHAPDRNGVDGSKKREKERGEGQ